jgi:hypothetical protein
LYTNKHFTKLADYREYTSIIMSQLTQALTNAASRNHELLSVLAETDYAAKTLQQNSSYITDLEAQTKATEKELRKLHAITEDERKDHVKYRDSTFKRYAHKLGGRKGEAKFASKSEKEEREFLEAWQKEREAEERKAELQRALNTANEDRQRFESEKARNESAQRDLDQLYASIFSGPTPDLPGEDQLESAVQYADNISSKFSHNPMPTPLRSMLFVVPRHACKLLPDP